MAEAKSTRACGVEGCDQSSRARGWCSMHYARWKSTGATGAATPKVGPRVQPEACSIDGCSNLSHCKSWCKTHYERWYTSGHPLGKPCRGCGEHFEGQFYCHSCKPMCSVTGCPDRVNARGLCSRHYMRVIYNGQGHGGNPCKTCGNPTDGKGRYCGDACRPFCAADGCGLIARANGYCATHNLQIKSFGEVRDRRWQRTPDGTPCAFCGAPWTDKSNSLKYCSKACASLYQRYGESRPMSQSCQRCGVEIDLTARTKTGRLRKVSTKMCARCKAARESRGKYTAAALAFLHGSSDCWLCREPVDMSLRYPAAMSGSSDHVIPYAKGGSNDISNLLLSHLDCNMRKQDRMPDEVRSVFPDADLELALRLQQEVVKV